MVTLTTPWHHGLQISQQPGSCSLHDRSSALTACPSPPWRISWQTGSAQVVDNLKAREHLEGITLGLLLDKGLEPVQLSSTNSWEFLNNDSFPSRSHQARHPPWHLFLLEFPLLEVLLDTNVLSNIFGHQLLPSQRPWHHSWHPSCSVVYPWPGHRQENAWLSTSLLRCFLLHDATKPSRMMVLVSKWLSNYILGETF